ncbi:protein of unknown function DUF1045 [Pseudodesulfovibrio mercurii]|uniref:Phosphonate metabolism protein n=1 Tax=Pseudodesulfovibrio mercurii TaxID=641491 RepID=F0JIK6_9BACT|nr:DUF1045 domain-containing protein [Pseudodesulfovibrio mercurii]EGB15440.1 protein of unknown function DUF1045 [Pseudodesulfovibrio mercurii]
MSISTSARYGVYYAPERGSDLERFGAAWLGRDNETGLAVDPVLPDGLSPDAWREATRSPRHYGFHGTLMPPFVPASGVDEAGIVGRLDGLARDLDPFTLAPLSVRGVGGFLALVPAEQVRLARDAEACLRAMTPLREPPSAEENRARREGGRLTPDQDRLLTEWGYPYVLGEFRFHITLTGRLEDPAERGRFAALLRDLAAPVTGCPHPVGELCLFHQPDRSAPFRLIHRARLGNPKENS